MSLSLPSGTPIFGQLYTSTKIPQDANLRKADEMLLVSACS